jgi:hypothetical protein
MRFGNVDVKRNRTGKTRRVVYGNGTWLLWLGPLFVSRFKRASPVSSSLGSDQRRKR